ncbi:MAG: GNAT family N-acetyltransferase [Gammaproteobacteria bacterium]
MTHYPEQFISTYQVSDGTNITLRPIQSEDTSLIKEFFHHLSSEAKHSHFLENFAELSNELLNKLIKIDYEREMVLIASYVKNGKEKMIGMAQYSPTHNFEECEVLIVIADEWHSKGIANQLMHHLIEIAKKKAFKKMIATIPSINNRDLSFAKSLGFMISDSDDSTIKNVTKLL